MINNIVQTNIALRVSSDTILSAHYTEKWSTTLYARLKPHAPFGTTGDIVGLICYEDLSLFTQQVYWRHDK